MSNPLSINSTERKTLLLLVDIILIVSNLYLFVFYVLRGRDYDPEKFKIEIIVFGTLIYIIQAYIFELYDLNKINKAKIIFPLTFFTGSLFSLTIYIGTIFTINTTVSRFFLILFLLFNPILITLWRILASKYMISNLSQKETLYIYDSEKDKENRIKTIEGTNGVNGYKISKTISLEDDSIFKNNGLKKFNAIILDVKDYNLLSREMGDFITKSLVQGKELQMFSTFYQSTYEALPIDLSNNNEFYEIIQMKNKKTIYLHILFSFFIDFFLSFFVGLFFFFITPFVYIINIFFNKGSLFFKQKRVGKNGKEFTLYKFRSMVENAEENGAKMASQNDSRVTPFGKILRKFRIDELPQIISVINGDMKFIGPRPERRVFIDQLIKETPFYDVRHVIKPGITGWAQVKYKYGQNLEDSINKLEFDLFYIKNRSITLDIRIIFKTASTILFS